MMDGWKIRHKNIFTASILHHQIIMKLYSAKTWIFIYLNIITCTELYYGNFLLICSKYLIFDCDINHLAKSTNCVIRFSLSKEKLILILTDNSANIGQIIPILSDIPN